MKLKKVLIATLAILLAVGVSAYAGSTKIEDEYGRGAVLNEDAAHSSAQPGIQLLTVRQNSAAALSGTDADYQPLITDTNGRLHVLDPNTSGAATSLAILDDWDSSDNCKIMINSRATGTSTPVNAVLLDDSPTSVTSAAVTITEYQRIGIYWTYDETEVGGGVECALTIQVSPDNVTYFSAPFFDTAGGATPQTSEVLSADGSYICWLDKNMPFSYMKVIVTGTATDADDTALNTVKLYYDK